VLGAALDLLAQDGPQALTMRALARRLAVAPNALYSHVPSRSALVDDLLDGLLEWVDPPDGDEDPVVGLTQVMTSTYVALTAHPQVVPLYLARQGARGPNAVRLGRTVDDLLVRAGVRGGAVAQARRILVVHTIGAAAFATSAPDTDRPISAEESLANFGQSLRWLLTGIVGTASTDDAEPGAPRRRRR
jgi:AcrR family transcriptional regulator